MAWGSSASNIELQRPINRATVEQAYRLAKLGQKHKRFGMAETGMRIARLPRDSRDHSKFLKVLDQAAEILYTIAEEQYGRTIRDPGTVHAERVTPTEYQAWREAFRTADAGDPCEAFAWIYGAAAWLAELYVW